MKKTIYITLAAVLGLLLSFIAHAGIEILYLNWAEKYDLPIKWVTIGSAGCALPLWLIVLLPILGILGGVLLGFFGWKKVYLEQIEQGRRKGNFLKVLLLILGLVGIFAIFWTTNFLLVQGSKTTPPQASPRSTLSPTDTFTFTPTPTSEPTVTLTPTATPVSSSQSTIQIEGDENCQSQTSEALNLLKERAPNHYQVSTQYIGIVECVAQGSGMFVWEVPPRYKAGDATRDSSNIWYAGTFPHEACHSKQYQEGREYLGENAEAECIQAQYNALEQLGASQEILDHVKNSLSTKYWEVDYEDRWW